MKKIKVFINIVEEPNFSAESFWRLAASEVPKIRVFIKKK